MREQGSLDNARRTGPHGDTFYPHSVLRRRAFVIVQSLLDMVFDDVFFDLGADTGPRRLLKLEGFNPTGSVKFKAALKMIEAAEAEGRCIPGRTEFVESSSGNMGVALSLVTRRKGYGFICVVDPNVLPINRRLIELHGATVRQVDAPCPRDGFLGARLALVKELLEDSPDRIWLDQYANAANRDGHRATTGASIFRSLDRVDALVVGTSTTGTLMGCAGAIRELSPDTRLIAVDVAGSAIFGGDPAPRHFPGIGSSLRPPLLDQQAVDTVVTVSETDCARACHDALARHGLCLGASTGAVLTAMARIAPTVADAGTVVGIGPDFGERYLDTLYDRNWLARHGLEPEGTDR